MDADRAAARAFHEMVPLIFDGTYRSVTLAAWLHDMEAIFRICHIEAHMQIPLATRCLARDARAWWRAIGSPAVLGGTWEEFRTQIIARYGPIPDADAAMPYRDQMIYDNMNFERYLNYVADWRAYPGETMSHYCRRFQETMWPHIPNFGDPERRALHLIRNGLPHNIRALVPLPIADMTLEEMIHEIIEAETAIHIMQVEALAGNNGGGVANEDQVVPEEPLEVEALQVLPPLNADLGALDLDQMNPPNNGEGPPEEEEEEEEEEINWDEEEVEEEEDPEEIPLDNEDLDVFPNEASD